LASASTPTKTASAIELREQKTGSASQSSPKRVRVFAAALVLFVLANLLVAVCTSSKEDSDGCIFHLRKFEAISSPQLVFMGSSMCNHVFEAVKPTDFDGVRTSSLAYNLQMCSDGYVLSDKYVRGNHVPSRMIIALGPRDLIDHDQADPTATTTFRYLVSLLDLPRYCPLYARDAQQAGSMIFDKLFFLSDRRRSMQFRLRQFFQHLYGVNETMPKTAEERIQRSIQEYKYRYSDPDPRQFDLQLTMLARIVHACRAQNIAVLVVILPVSPDNVNALGQGLYAKMQAALENTAKGNGADFFNAAISRTYIPTDFYDTAHLNTCGARKVIEALQSHLHQQSEPSKRATLGS
jgi:hypothetical protein